MKSKVVFGQFSKNTKLDFVRKTMRMQKLGLVPERFDDSLTPYNFETRTPVFFRCLYCMIQCIDVLSGLDPERFDYSLTPTSQEPQYFFRCLYQSARNHFLKCGKCQHEVMRSRATYY